MNSSPATTEKFLESSPVNYSILRSKYKRFNDKPFGEVRLPLNILFTFDKTVAK
jgi:hypothetical protein